MNASAANATPADGNETVFDEWATEVVTAVYLYYTPLLVLLGCVGNALSVWVFYRSKLRHLSSSQYLAALALSDTIFLLHLLPPWMSATSLSSMFHRPYWCEVFTYCSYVTCCISAWLVMAFTLERCVAVLQPLRRGACTTRRSRTVVFCIVTFALLCNLPVMRFAAPRQGECSVDVAYEAHAARFNVVDTTLVFTVPMSAIVILNGVITLSVCRLDRARRHLVTENEAGPPPPARSPRSQRRVTRMMVLVSSAFVVLNLPAYTIRIFAYGYGLSATEIGGRWTALQQISLMCFHTNFGINFILYCVSGQNFRRALMEALPCCCRRKRRAALARRTGANQARASSISNMIGVKRKPINYKKKTSPNAVVTSHNYVTRPSMGVQTTTQPEGSNLSTCNETGGAASAAAATTAAATARAAAMRRRHVNAPALRQRQEVVTRATIETPSSAAARRPRPERFIKRWTFDNSRTPRPALRTGVVSTNVEAVELTTLGKLGKLGSKTTATAYIHTTQF